MHSTTTARCPIVEEGSSILLKNARHTLLAQTLRKEGKSVVPLDLVLTPQKHILVISGPNAGGKSVCLKTVGLLQYMMQCGLLVSASENSEMGIFRSIFIDIGDEQSIDNDLSTYSSHLLNMKNILAPCRQPFADPDRRIQAPAQNRSSAERSPKRYSNNWKRKDVSE